MPDSTSPRLDVGPLNRRDRIALLYETFEALLDGRLPCLEAQLFVGGGGLSWLRRGGRLTRDFWRVDPPRGSKQTVERLAADLGSSSTMTGDGAYEQSPSSTMTAGIANIDHLLAGRRVIRCQDNDDEDDE